MMTLGTGSMLEVKDLKMYYETSKGPVKAVDGVSFSIPKGKVLVLVGESGSGKTATSLTLMQLQSPGRIVAGSITLDGVDLLALSSKEMQRARGKDIAMIFQQPRSALDPVMRVGRQITEALQAHEKISKKEARKAADAMLRSLGLADPERLMKAYPFELSGGMAQRIVIAIALVFRPKVLIADEPTTALDVTTQAQILVLFKQLIRETGAAVLYVTHDLAVAAELADDVAVMYAGKIVEVCPKDLFFRGPRHPYSQALLQAIPVSKRYTSLYQIPGDVPDMVNPPPGCRFNPRCPYAAERCRQEEPLLRYAGDGRLAACHFWEEIQLRSGPESRTAGARTGGS
jgi:peptide/nickel transport system ATP-binding protein